MAALTYMPAVHVEIRQSKGKGRGVFATRRIRGGQVIETVPALLVPKSQVDALAETFLGHYMFTTDNNKNLVIGLGITSLLNHDDDANAEFYVTIDSVTIKAKRAIPAGTEITINYSWRAEEWARLGVELPRPKADVD
ncbi:MAG TPA: SET domain-containing protein-lysine N-methyltransferase [Oligoflexus sp.]|uniref:SET domain-containing protein n=1 Tax=Oligoflexus sp. TaxID=1971216 RepID=UPI002D60CF59|nr:SET domain-containing protein-lysine N-methyltransferase [Oligoflexus sp.]HYX37506.1 SET domain-containing protein-lysine N-methyltransferase [Oligoflexus sp.]